MNATVESTMTGLFDQAVRSFGDAIKAGVKMQEDATRWWSDTLEKSSPLADWQKRSLAGVKEAIPVAQKNAEEFLRLVEGNYRKSVDLLKRAFETRDADTIADLQGRIQELWEGSMKMVKEAAQTVAQNNVKMMEFYAELLRKNMEGAAAAAKVVPQAK